MVLHQRRRKWLCKQKGTTTSPPVFEVISKNDCKNSKIVPINDDYDDCCLPERKAILKNCNEYLQKSLLKADRSLSKSSHSYSSPGTSTIHEDTQPKQQHKYEKKYKHDNNHHTLPTNGCISEGSIPVCDNNTIVDHENKKNCSKRPKKSATSPKLNKKACLKRKASRCKVLSTTENTNNKTNDKIIVANDEILESQSVLSSYQKASDLYKKLPREIGFCSDDDSDDNNTDSYRIISIQNQQEEHYDDKFATVKSIQQCRRFTDVRREIEFSDSDNESV